jgi:hypothetical protein
MGEPLKFEKKYKDYYKILGISRTATIEEIEVAYGRLAQLYHSDRNGELFAAKLYARILEAYDILRDPIRRNAYNQEYEIAMKNSAGTTQGSAEHDHTSNALFIYGTSYKNGNQFTTLKEYFCRWKLPIAILGSSAFIILCTCVLIVPTYLKNKLLAFSAFSLAATLTGWGGFFAYRFLNFSKGVSQWLSNYLISCAVIHLAVTRAMFHKYYREFLFDARSIRSSVSLLSMLGTLITGSILYSAFIFLEKGDFRANMRSERLIKRDAKPSSILWIVSGILYLFLRSFL